MPCSGANHGPEEEGRPPVAISQGRIRVENTWEEWSVMVEKANGQSSAGDLLTHSHSFLFAYSLKQAFVDSIGSPSNSSVEVIEKSAL